METIIYIISISLQVAGALLLLRYATSTKRLDVIRSFGGNGIITGNEEEKEISYNHDAFKETYRTAYLSKVAFVFIALGYFFGVFGVIEWESKIAVGATIVVVTYLLMKSTYWCVGKIIDTKDSVNKEITYEELKEAGVKPDLAEVTSNEIKKMFENKN